MEVSIKRIDMNIYKNKAWYYQNISDNIVDREKIFEVVAMYFIAEPVYDLFLKSKVLEHTIKLMYVVNDEDRVYRNIDAKYYDVINSEIPNDWGLKIYDRGLMVPKKIDVNSFTLIKQIISKQEYLASDEKLYYLIEEGRML